MDADDSSGQLTYRQISGFSCPILTLVHLLNSVGIVWDASLNTETLEMVENPTSLGNLLFIFAYIAAILIWLQNTLHDLNPVISMVCSLPSDER